MDIYQKMAERWPSNIVARSEVGNFSGGLVKPHTLANQDSLGTGPQEKLKCGNKIAYPTEVLADWIRNRSKKKGA